MTEAVNQASTFEECTFGNVRFNASRHTAAAFVGCTFKRCNFFDAEFTGCKLVGSNFRQCVVRPLRVLSDVDLTGGATLSDEIAARLP